MLGELTLSTILLPCDPDRESLVKLSGFHSAALVERDGWCKQAGVVDLMERSAEAYVAAERIEKPPRVVSPFVCFVDAA